jgi:hypothetical protein
MLTSKQIKALKWAVKEAEAWRGSLTGGFEGDLRNFDKNVADAKEALKEVQAMNKREKQGA